MPSGILCKAIPIVKVIPKVKSCLLEIKVVIPSGILWKIRASTETKPNLYKLLVENLASILLSIKEENNIPSTTKIPVSKIVGTTKKFSLIRLTVSGINDEKEIHNITPAAKLKQNGIITLCFCFFI